MKRSSSTWCVRIDGPTHRTVQRHNLVDVLGGDALITTSLASRSDDSQAPLVETLPSFTWQSPDIGHPDGEFRVAPDWFLTWWWPATCSATSCPISVRPAPARSVSHRAADYRERKFPSLFEVGMALLIAGKGIANPVGQASAAMMLISR